MSDRPRWISKTLLLAIHGRLLAEHPGAVGLREEGLLESALAAPRDLYEYEESDVFDLAATYAHAIMRNHPFVDGKKRIALVAAGLFLELNRHRLTASEVDAVQAVLALSESDLDAKGFADWLRMNSTEVGPGD